MPMNDEMKLRLSVEGGTQGAKELEKVTTAVDGTEKAVRKLGTSAKPGATPFDGVAIAAERAAKNVAALNQTISTSTQQLGKVAGLQPSQGPSVEFLKLKENADAAHEIAMTERQRAFERAKSSQQADYVNEWEQLGAKLGQGLKLGAVAAGALAINFAETIGQEAKQDRLEAEKWAADMAATSRNRAALSGEALISRAAHLNDQIEAQAVKAREAQEPDFKEGPISWLKSQIAERGRQTWNDMGGAALGFHAKTRDDAQTESDYKQAQLRSQQQQDIQRAIELGQRELEISGLKLSGQTKLAEEKERELKLEQEIAHIKALNLAGPNMDTGGKKAEQDVIELAREASRQQADAANLERSSHAEKIAQAEEKVGQQLATEAQVTALLAQHRSAEAVDLQRAATLQETITGILRMQIPPTERLAMLNTAIAEGAAKQAIAEQARADAAKSRMQMAQDEQDGANARLEGETAQAQIAAINKRLERQLDADKRNSTPEEFAKLKVMREQTAELQSQSAIKNQTAKEKHKDEQFSKEKTDAEFNVRIAQAKAKGGDAEAVRRVVEQLTEEKKLAEKIAGINRELTDEQKAQLKALYEKEAALGRVERLTRKAVDAANAEIAHRDKNGDQLREERTAKLTRESKKRGQVGRELDAEDKARADARERQMTPAEREALRQEKFKERGLDENGRERKPKAAKDLFAERNKARGDGEWDGTQEDIDNLTGGPGDKGGMMSEKDIAGDAPVEVDAAPVAQAVEQAGQGMATSIVEQISSAIAGVQASVQIDTGSVVSAVNSAISAVRSEIQAQIDKLASDINSNG